MSSPDPVAAVFAQISAARRSVRAYRSDPVPDAVLHALLLAARQAPSGANLQPGHFTQLRGAPRQALCDALTQAYRAGRNEPEDYRYFPDPMPGSLRRRQVAAARALYGALDIARDDTAARAQQFARNFCFFDAPVALVVTIARDFGAGGYMDLGMSLYGLMLAAQAQGLASCAIGALASYPGVVRAHLQLGPEHAVVCGLALGYPAPDAPVNTVQTDRCALGEYFRVIE